MDSFLKQLSKPVSVRMLNALSRGEPSVKVAREIQSQGYWQSLSEDAAVKILNRLRARREREARMSTSVLQPIAAAPVPVVAPQPTVAEIVSSKLKTVPLSIAPRVLEHLDEVLCDQRDRYKKMLEKEKMGIPSKQLNGVMRDYVDFLVTTQKLRFELGLDKFHSTTPVTASRSTVSTTQLPDGTVVQKQVFEALTAVDKVLAKNGF
jgi:hypothetical protein